MSQLTILILLSRYLVCLAVAVSRIHMLDMLCVGFNYLQSQHTCWICCVQEQIIRNLRWLSKENGLSMNHIVPPLKLVSTWYVKSQLLTVSQTYYFVHRIGDERQKVTHTQNELHTPVVNDHHILIPCLLGDQRTNRLQAPRHYRGRYLRGCQAVHDAMDVIQTRIDRYGLILIIPART